MSFGWSAWAVTVGWAAFAVAVVLALTFVIAKIVHRHNVIDVTWGLLFCAVAGVSFATSVQHGDAVRRSLLLGLPLIWGLRLAQHIGRRSVGKGEDPRYTQLLAKARGNRDLYALRMVYSLQGLLALVIATPITIGAHEPAALGPLGWLGVVVWAIGLFFESVGDAQLDSWRRDPEHKGKVIDIGLWRYTRHPNYFGDACVWWGIFLVAADGWPGVLTIFAPIVMTLLLTKGSGARILDKHMSQRPGWDDYAARTSGFFPLPPKRPGSQERTQA